MNIGCERKKIGFFHLTGVHKVFFLIKLWNLLLRLASGHLLSEESLPGQGGVVLHVRPWVIPSVLTAGTAGGSAVALGWD